MLSSSIRNALILVTLAMPAAAYAGDASGAAATTDPAAVPTTTAKPKAASKHHKGKKHKGGKKTAKAATPATDAPKP